MKNTIRKGMIVVVKTGALFGTRPNTVTKVLSRPGRVDDRIAKSIGTFYPKNVPLVQGTVLCDNPKGQLSCNGKPCSAERIEDLRPATEAEKDAYRTNYYQPIVYEPL